MANCEACDNLREYAPNFLVNGITDTECESLQENVGLNPDLDVLHTNCEDLNDMLDCLIGNHADKLPAYDICSLKEYTAELMKNMYNMYKAMLCSECGQWKYLDALIDANGYITVTKTFSYTVPIEKFISFGNPDNNIYWSGSGSTGESYISIPVSEMTIVDTIVAQPQVVPDRAHAVTVAIQENERSGDNFIVNFDTYEIQGSTTDAFPFAVPIEFIVVGRKKVMG